MITAVVAVAIVVLMVAVVLWLVALLVEFGGGDDGPADPPG